MNIGILDEIILYRIISLSRSKDLKSPFHSTNSNVINDKLCQKINIMSESTSRNPFRYSNSPGSNTLFNICN